MEQGAVKMSEANEESNVISIVEPDWEEVRLQEERERIIGLIEVTQCLYEIVVSGSPTPKQDCIDAGALLHHAFCGYRDERALDPLMSWFVDSLSLPLHEVLAWEEVPFEVLPKVLDRLIVVLNIKRDRKEREITTRLLAYR